MNEEQKWDYITLSDFKSTSCATPFSYVWVWILAIISVAVYAGDAFTAINLLAFNKWSSEVAPSIPFTVSKWIFAICIIISYVLCGFYWLRAIRIIRAGGVAESYLDPLAVVLQSLRVGKTGQGWRRFLVFAELTKSKKGVDYIALFVYFQFKGALVIILAEGPRAVVNALTLWAVMKASLIPEGKNAPVNGHSSIQQFWINVDTLAHQNKEETVIYFTMLFTLVIWVISAISLAIAVILYLLFLWHYIPSTDGRLSIYCRRKVDSRLESIVGVKIKKAIEKQDAKRRKEEQKAIKKGELPNQPQRAPTLPVLSDIDDDKGSVYSLSKSDTTGTLPPYTSQPPTRTNTMGTNRTGISRQPTLPSFPEDVKRPLPPPRSDTQSSYSSNAPLLSQAGDMGYGDPGRSGSPVPSMPPYDQQGDYFSKPPMNRTMTGDSQSSQRSYAPMPQSWNSPAPNGMPQQPNNVFGPPSRINTAFSSDGRNSPSPHLISPLPNSNEPRPGPPSRQNTGFGSAGRRMPGPSPLHDPTFSPFDRRNPAQGPAYEMSPVDISPSAPKHQPPRNQTQSPYQNTDDYDPFRSPTPAQHGPAYPPPSLIPGNPNNNGNGGNGNGGYVAFNPSRHAQTPDAARSASVPPPSNFNSNSNPGSVLPAVLQSAIQRREASNPLPYRGPGSVPPQRSVTAPIQQGWGQEPVQRSATAGPQRRGEY